jgi:hypothetical protein
MLMNPVVGGTNFCTAVVSGLRTTKDEPRAMIIHDGHVLLRKGGMRVQPLGAM